MPEFFDPIFKYIVVPICGWIWYLHKRQTDHAQDIAVLKSQTNETHKTLERILNKLDDIEEVLRK